METGAPETPQFQASQHGGRLVPQGSQPRSQRKAGELGRAGNSETPCPIRCEPEPCPSAILSPLGLHGSKFCNGTTEICQQ